jgi:hypothetical protein
VRAPRCDHLDQAIRPLKGAYIVFDQDLPSRGGAPEEGGGSPCDVDELIERGQRLVDAPWPYDGYPYEWHVEAWLIGDLGALASVILSRSQE